MKYVDTEGNALKETDKEEVNQSFIEHTIVVPSIDEAYAFRRDCYDHTILAEIIDKPQFDKIINRASVVMGNCLLEKTKNDTFTHPLRFKIISVTSVVCLLLFVLLFIFSESQSEPLFLFITSVIFLVLGVLLILIESIISYFTPIRHYISLSHIITINMNNYFEKVNQQLNDEDKDLVFEFDPEYRSIRVTVLQQISQSNKRVLETVGEAYDDESANEQKMILRDNNIDESSSSSSSSSYSEDMKESNYDEKDSNMNNKKNAETSQSLHSSEKPDITFDNKKGRKKK